MYFYLFLQDKVLWHFELHNFPDFLHEHAFVYHVFSTPTFVPISGADLMYGNTASRLR